MRCYECREKLPFLIQQLYKTEDSVSVEIQCVNPSCRKINVVSIEYYLLSRNETFTHIPKHIQRTTKLPGEMNVMFVSMERTGISWIVRRLNFIHEILFERSIDYAPELSRQIATKERFELPQGWFCVYEVDPRALLKRGYDKVVSIQRPRWVMHRVNCMYYKPELSFEECKEQYPNYIEKIDKYYDMMFKDVGKIKDSRYINIQLDDLNKYTVATFTELLDFLNFPKVGLNMLVPVLIPVNPPERNWQAWSTILTKDEQIGSKLKKMQEKYGKFIIDKDYEKVQSFFNELEEEFQKWNKKKSRILSNRLREIQEIYENGRLEAEIQDNNPKSVYPPAKQKVQIRKCPPRIVRFEKDVQNGKKFRLYPEDIEDALEKEEKYRILVLGPIGYGYGCHLSEGMTKAFAKLGHEVAFINYRELINKQMFQKPQNISDILKVFLKGEKPDFVFHNEMRIKLVNDLKIPWFYFHTGWYLEPNVQNPHIYYFRQPQLIDAYQVDGRITDTLYQAVDPDHFYPEEKTIKGVNGIGFRKPWKKWFHIVGSLKPFVEVMQKETEQFIDLGYPYHHTPIDDMKYRALLRKMEALNPLIAYGEYITRRMIEGMACKTLLVYRLDFTLKNGMRNDTIHRNMIKDLGFEAGKHFIEIKDNYDIIGAWNEMTEEMKEEMRERAYKVVMENHTHINRAKQIINDFESGRWQKATFHIDNEEDAQRREAHKFARMKELEEIKHLLIK